LDRRAAAHAAAGRGRRAAERERARGARELGTGQPAGAGARTPHAADAIRDVQGRHRRPGLRLSAADRRAAGTRDAPARAPLPRGRSAQLDDPHRVRTVDQGNHPMIRLRSLSLLLFVALLVPAARPVLRAQPDVEELARRQFESGLEFYRAGRYAEAMKDFQTVAEGYSESSVADDAMLAIAQYQLEVLRDAQAAK